MKKKREASREESGKKFYCEVCGCEIDEAEYENFDGMCWACWDDQLTEESDDMFGVVM